MFHLAYSGADAVDECKRVLTCHGVYYIVGWIPRFIVMAMLIPVCGVTKMYLVSKPEVIEYLQLEAAGRLHVDGVNDRQLRLCRLVVSKEHDNSHSHVGCRKLVPRV